MTPDPARLPPAAEVLARCAPGMNVAVFLDYDGTLTPIVARPELAVLSADARRALKHLARTASVAIISGRLLDDVAGLVDVAGLTYAGDHGFEVAYPDGTRTTYAPADAVAQLRQAADRLPAVLESLAGVWVEPKRFTIAVHAREAAAHLAAARTAVLREIERWPDLLLTQGKMVLEVRPRLSWDKGAAVNLLLETNPGAPVDLAIYAGDDRTDEDAFAVMRALGPERGISILVGGPEEPPSTAARYRLSGPAETVNWLEALAARLDGSP